MPADNATGDWVWHVRNDKVGSLTAALRVDGKAFSLLGPLGQAAAPQPAAKGPACTPGLNFGGGDLPAYCPVADRSVRTADACRALCAKVDGCVGFIFDTCTGAAPGCNRSQHFEAPHCWLKERMGGTGEPHPCSCAGFMHKPNPRPAPKPGAGTANQCPAGHAIPPLPQTAPAVILPTRTIYSYAGSGVAVNLTFASPKFMEDLDSFLPVALVQISVAATDGRTHDIEAFFELTGQLSVEVDTQKVSWARDTQLLGTMPQGAASMQIYNPAAVPLSETGSTAAYARRQPTEHLDWGRHHLTALPTGAGAEPTSWMGSSNVARDAFASAGKLPTADETVMPIQACQGGVCRCGPGGRGAQNDWPSLTASWSLPSVGKEMRHARAVMSSDDGGSSARYFGTVMGEWWRRSGRLSFDGMLSNVTTNFDSVMAQCEAYDEEMVQVCTNAFVRKTVHVQQSPTDFGCRRRCARPEARILR